MNIFFLDSVLVKAEDQHIIIGRINYFQDFKVFWFGQQAHFFLQFPDNRLLPSLCIIDITLWKRPSALLRINIASLDQPLGGVLAIIDAEPRIRNRNDGHHDRNRITVSIVSAVETTTRIQLLFGKLGAAASAVGILTKRHNRRSNHFQTY